MTCHRTKTSHNPDHILPQNRILFIPNYSFCFLQLESTFAQEVGIFHNLNLSFSFSISYLPQTMYAHFQTYAYWAVLSHSLLHPDSHPQSMCAHSHTHRGRTPTEQVCTQPHTHRGRTVLASVYEDFSIPQLTPFIST